MKELYIANNFLLWSHDYSVSIIYDNQLYCIELDKYLWIKWFWWELKYHNINRLYKVVVDILREYISDVELLKSLHIYNINYFWKKINISNNITYYNIFDHHYLHACSAYYPSEFEESAILIIDDYWSIWDWMFESCSTWLWRGTIIEKLHSNIWNTKESVSSIWRAYSLYSTFIWLEEGSIMWLSSYWKIDEYKNIKLFSFDWDNVFFDENRDLHKLYDVNEEDIWQKSKDITKSKFADISAHLQKQVEEAIVYLANRLYEKTKCENLCLAWGVALNILSNTKILEQTSFKNIFVQPAANDGWLSMWAVYHAYHKYWKNEKRIKLDSAWLWKQFLKDEIIASLNNYSNYLHFEEIKNIENKLALLLNSGKIIWYFQWKNEYWPRALWFRSILASPVSIAIRDRVNKIKNRQSWRPLAPVILEENKNDYFSLEIKSPYMTFSSDVKQDKKTQIPWVVHIDGTSRYQSINKMQNNNYYNLLKEFYKYSNIPLLINTSFNVSWQAIVYWISDAIETFLSTELDYLIMENYLITKNNIYDIFAYSHEKQLEKINYINENDYNIYMKNWDYLRRILFNNDIEINFTYWDNQNKYFYSNNKYCFQTIDWIKIVIEPIDTDISYFKQINVIWIKIDNKNFELNDYYLTILNRMNQIINTYYEKLKILFWV